MEKIKKWDYNEEKLKLLEMHSDLFNEIYKKLEEKSWFYKMLERESKRHKNFDLLKTIVKLDSIFLKNFSICLLTKCIILSLSSQELKDSSGLRYVFGNKCTLMYVNTLMNFEKEIDLYNLNLKIILKTVIWKTILYLELEKIIETKIIHSKNKKISTIKYIKSNLDFNDDFRFQKTKYNIIQNIMCSYEDIEINDLIISCEMYEFNQPFLIKNIRNNHISRNDFSEIYELINNETIIDIDYYEFSFNEWKKDKLKEIEGLSKNNINDKIIKNIERLINKKKKFLEYIKINNRIYFMKKICFRARFYEISELGVTNSKEIRYSILYDKMDKSDILNNFDEIKKTKYYAKIKDYTKFLKNKEIYLEKNKEYNEEVILCLAIVITISIGMEFKNEMIKENIKTNIENFILWGENWFNMYLKNEKIIYEIDEWEKRVYLKKLSEYLINWNIYEGFIINKDYSSSVFFNMIRMFSSDIELNKAFNVGECDEWSCGYTYLINIMKKKIEKKNEFINNFLVKKNLKRALMCQPYNVGKISASRYMKENISESDYIINKEKYDEIIELVIKELSVIKKEKLFKNEFKDIIEKIIQNNYILDLSDISISLSYFKVNKKKRIILKTKEGRKTILMMQKEEEIDFRKSNIAMCANIMHSIDAFEMRTILKNLKKKKSKNIHAIHDCVICNIFDFFKINDIANRDLDYISKPLIKVIKNIGYSMYIFS